MKCLRGSLRPTHARTTPRCAAQRRSSIRRRAQSDDDTRGAHVEMSEYVSSFTSDEAVALRASLERPRCDVFDPSIHLRAMLPSRPNPWSDGMPYVPDGDLVSLRVVHHSHSAHPSSVWANVGGCLYGPRHEASPEHPTNTPLLSASYVVRAGPRDLIYFDPPSTRAAIVTMGGLCPGLNDCIKGLVNALEAYGVRHIVGIRYGLRGFYTDDHPPVRLDGDNVETIHLLGGTVLGTSRGGADIAKVVDAIMCTKLSQVYMIGGNGGHAAAAAVHHECIARGYPCSIVGLPKSVDNDLLLIDRCFGFATACAEANAAILAASVEARSAYYGIGLVKLMGRQSGFIAAESAIASGAVDVCVIPEAQIRLEALLPFLHERVRSRGHAVIVVAEGAFQDEIRAELAISGGEVPAAMDASGNPKLLDVSCWLREKIKAYFETAPTGTLRPDIKLISPSYMIRSVPAHPMDKVFCRMLSWAAVHGAFAGYSGFTSAVVSRHHAYLPLEAVIRDTRRIDPRGRLYRMMRAALGQPLLGSASAILGSFVDKDDEGDDAPPAVMVAQEDESEGSDGGGEEAGNE